MEGIREKERGGREKGEGMGGEGYRNGRESLGGQGGREGKGVGKRAGKI